MTLNEAAYNILNTLSGGRSTDNEFRSLEQVKFTLLYYRALFGRRELDKGRRTVEMEQTLWSIPVSEPETDILPDRVTGVYVTDVLPKIVRLKSVSGLVHIQTAAGDKIPQIPFASVEAASWSRYTGGKPRAFETDGRLGISFHDGTALTIRGVFEDPRAAHDFNQLAAGGTDFWDDDVNPLPLPADLYAQITEGILSNELRLMTTTQTDLVANQVPDAAQ